MMQRMAPDWLIQVIWFIAGVFATGAVWYFLSQNNHFSALWSAFGAAMSVLLAVTLFIQNDLVRRKEASLTRERPTDVTSTEKNAGSNVQSGDRDKLGERFQTSVDDGGKSNKASTEVDASRWPPIRVRLADQTILDVELSLQFQVKAENAPKVVAQLGPFENVGPFLQPLVEAAILSELSRLTYPQLAKSLSEVSANVTRAVATRAQAAGITVHGIYITKLTRCSG